MAVSAAAPADGTAKIEPALAECFAVSADGRASFVVLLKEQADLSPAGRLPTNAAKGRFVFDALRATARRTQQPVLDQLAMAGAESRSFWIVNAVWGRGLINDALLAAHRCPVPAAPAVPGSPRRRLSPAHQAPSSSYPNRHHIITTTTTTPWFALPLTLPCARGNGILQV